MWAVKDTAMKHGNLVECCQSQQVINNQSSAETVMRSEVTL